jgi:hypothetical protein
MKTKLILGFCIGFMMVGSAHAMGPNNISITVDLSNPAILAARNSIRTSAEAQAHYNSVRATIIPIQAQIRPFQPQMTLHIGNAMRNALMPVVQPTLMNPDNPNGFAAGALAPF